MRRRTRDVWKSSGQCVLWELSSEPHGSALAIEFIAARRPQAVGVRGSPLGEASSPATLTVLISGMSRILVMDEAFGPRAVWRASHSGWNGKASTGPYRAGMPRKSRSMARGSRSS
ncbi:hypothetical protein [Streptomyces sp. NPDC093591]|uniref:hypothetical protein n=1 Tax=Streptomyces sp. NPDC093591 TaxID=3366044 RepID=UPI00382728A7